MTKTQAQRAVKTLEDVFTADDDAVSLEFLSTRNGVPGAKGAGHDNEVGLYFEKWYPLTELTAVEDL